MQGKEKVGNNMSKKEERRAKEVVIKDQVTSNMSFGNKEYCQGESFIVEERPNSNERVMRIILGFDDDDLLKLVKTMLELELSNDLYEKIIITKPSKHLGKHLSLYVNISNGYQKVHNSVLSFLNRSFKDYAGSLKMTQQLEQKLKQVCPKSAMAYRDCIKKLKLKSNTFKRNTMDDMRLALEFVLKVALLNNNSIEQQIAALDKDASQKPLGKYLISEGRDNEVDGLNRSIYEYKQFQNSHVKHNYDMNINQSAVNYMLYSTNVLIIKLLSLVQVGNFLSFPKCRDAQNCKGCKK